MPAAGVDRAAAVPDAVPDAVPRVEPRSRNGNPPFYDVFGKRYYVLSSSVGYWERGVASWYGPGFHKVRTSTGEPYDMYGMTAAHKTLPLPAYVRVTNLQNGRSVVVRVNDRGPFVGNRIIDLSYTAAAKLDMLRNGTAMVEVRSLDPTVAAAADSPPRVTGAAAAAAPLPAPPRCAAPTATLGHGHAGGRAGRRRARSSCRPAPSPILRMRNAWRKNCAAAVMARSSCATIRLPAAECTACASGRCPTSQNSIAWSRHSSEPASTTRILLSIKRYCRRRYVRAIILDLHFIHQGIHLSMFRSLRRPAVAVSPHFAAAHCLAQTPAAPAPGAASMAIPTAPQVDARAYILVDYRTGKILAAKDAVARMEPASLTKLMTAYIVFQELAAASSNWTSR